VLARDGVIGAGAVPATAPGRWWGTATGRARRRRPRCRRASRRTAVLRCTRHFSQAPLNLGPFGLPKRGDPIRIRYGRALLPCTSAVTEPGSTSSEITCPLRA
jgi:hypothetical protein